MATKPFPRLSPAVLLPRNDHCSSNSEWHSDARAWQCQGASGRVPCVTWCHAPFGLLLSLEMSQPLHPGHCGLPWAWGSLGSPALRAGRDQHLQTAASMGRMRIVGIPGRQLVQE